MKLQIVAKEEEKIQGFTHIQCFGVPLDLSSVADNECELILAGDVLDLYPISSVGQVIQQLASKLRTKGQIVLGGTEYRVFAKSVLNGLITDNQASTIIENKRSFTNVNLLKDALTGLGMKVISTSIDGIHCEVKAQRG